MTKCKVCNCELASVPMSFSSPSPASLMVSPEDYSHRVKENADQCIVDDEYFFIRGHIEIPIKGSTEVFCWSVWVSLSKQSFSAMSESWEEEGRENVQPYFGWLMSNLPGYPETLHLKTNVITQPVGSVPLARKRAALFWLAHV